MALGIRPTKFKIPDKPEERVPGERTGMALTLDHLDEFSGGDINGILVWKKNGDVDFYDVEGKRATAEGGGDPPAPKRSMKDHGVWTADIVLINGNPKIASINGKRYFLYPPADKPKQVQR